MTKERNMRIGSVVRLVNLDGSIHNPLLIVSEIKEDLGYPQKIEGFVGVGVKFEEDGIIRDYKRRETFSKNWDFEEITHIKPGSEHFRKLCG